MPTGVACTIRSAAVTSSARPTRPMPGASAAAVSAAAAVRLTTTTSRQPASVNASTTARAAPPAPSTATVRPRGSMSWSRRTESTNPPPSVLSPAAVPSSENTTVLAACRAVTVGDGRSTRPATSVLWGIVTDSPSMPRSRPAPSAALAWPAGTGNARYTASRSQAAKAALCMAGESEWRTGQPMMPATRVLPPTGRAAGRTVTRAGPRPAPSPRSSCGRRSWWRRRGGPRRRPARSRARCRGSRRGSSPDRGWERG